MQASSFPKGDRSLEHRRAYERRRASPDRANNSLQRTYALLRSHLHSIDPGGSLVEADLIRSLSSSRNTVRTALRLLADEGVVLRKTKVGTTARGYTLLPMNEILSDEQATDSYRIRRGVETSIITVPELVRIWLRLEPRSSVAVIDTLIYSGDEPIGTSIGYVGLTAEQAARFPHQHRDTVSFLEESLGIELGESEIRVATVSCDAETASRLGLEAGSAMLWLEDLISDIDGRPRAIKQVWLRGDRVAFTGIARRPAGV